MATKELILTAAKERFLERGFHGTSMRDITNKSGISQGGIYSYFASKEELFKAVLDDSIPCDEFLIGSQDIISEKNDPEIFFQELAMTFLNTYKAENMKLRMIDFLEFKGKYFHVLCTEKTKGKPNLLLEKIAEFINDGKIKKDTAHSIFLGFSIAVFSYLFMKSYIMEEAPIKEELLSTVDIVLHGILINKEQTT